MPGYYPALPQPFEVQHPEAGNWSGALQSGLSGGLQDAKLALENQKSQRAYEQDLKTEEALKGYATSGDINPVMQANPKLGLAFQKEMRTADAEHQKLLLESATKGVDFLTKSLPYLSDPVNPPSPERWALFRESATRLGLRHLVPPQYSTQWINWAAEQNRDLKGVLSREDLRGINRLDVQTLRNQGPMNILNRKIESGYGGGMRSGTIYGDDGLPIKTGDEREAARIARAEGIPFIDALQRVRMAKKAQTPQKEVLTDVEIEKRIAALNKEQEAVYQAQKDIYDLDEKKRVAKEPHYLTQQGRGFLSFPPAPTTEPAPPPAPPLSLIHIWRCRRRG